jgi:hypothetical protein
MEKRTRQLAAWIENGQLRLIPSLLEELSRPYLAEIASLYDRYQGEKDELAMILRLSRTYEAYGNLLLGCGRLAEAYRQFVESACVCLSCSDRFWLDGEFGWTVVRPLRTRFYMMYGRCKRMLRSHPTLAALDLERRLDADYESIQLTIVA